MQDSIAQTESVALRLLPGKILGQRHIADPIQRASREPHGQYWWGCWAKWPIASFLVLTKWSDISCEKPEKTAGYSEGKADFFVLGQQTSLKLHRDCCLVCRCTTTGFSSQGAPSQHCSLEDERKVAFTSWPLGNYCIPMMWKKKYETQKTKGDVVKRIWNLVRVMKSYDNSNQLVYKCKFPVELAQSWWWRPGSSINSTGSVAHSCTAPMEPALGQHRAHLHLGQVRKQRQVEGTFKYGRCSQSSGKGSRKFLSNFGSPIDALNGLLTNISLTFLLPPLLCKVLCFSMWKKLRDKRTFPSTMSQIRQWEQSISWKLYCLEEAVVLP